MEESGVKILEPDSIPGNPFKFFGIWLNASRKGKWIFIVLASILPLLSVLLHTMIFLKIPLEKTKNDNPMPGLQGRYQPDKAQLELQRLMHERSGLLAEEIFLKSRLSLASEDSIAVVMNLRDSTLALTIREVSVRTCRISKIQIGNALQYLHHAGRTGQWIHSPIKSRSWLSTIPKADILTVKAPRDTVEAKKILPAPRSFPDTDVFYSIQFDSSLTVEFAQNERMTFRGSLRYFIYSIKRWMDGIVRPAGELIKFRIPEHTLRIKVFLKREDAKVVFQSTPEQVKLVMLM